MEMHKYGVVFPSKWKAGHSAGETLYFACARCETKAPEIAGFIAGPSASFADIAQVRIEGSAFVKPAMYCAPCWATVEGSAK